MLLREVKENLIHLHFVTLSRRAVPDLKNRFTVYLAQVCVHARTCVYMYVCCPNIFNALKTLKERSAELHREA